MYSPKIVIQQVIKLFTDQPKFRDERYDTVEYIVKTFYSERYGKSVKTDFKLMTDIDRSFRYVQNCVPQLRGKKWVDRQRKAGEISKEEYRRMKKMEDDIKNIANQMKLEF